MIKKESAAKLRLGGDKYTTLPNKTIDLIGNADSLALLCYLLSKSENWIVRHSDIKNKFNWGKQKCQNAINHLRELCLLETVEVRNESGHLIGKEIIIYSSPNTQLTDSRLNRTSEKPKVGESGILPKDQFLPSNQLIPNDQYISDKPKKAQLDWSLCSDLTSEDIAEIKTIRGKNKLTQRVVNSLCKEINLSLQAGATIDNILTLWGEKGWRAYKHEWAVNATQPNQPNNNYQANQPTNELGRAVDENGHDWVEQEIAARQEFGF